jgi:hypothetical protein
MKTLLSLTLLTLISACGVETVGTAAIQAEARKHEAEAAQQMQVQARQQIEQAMQQGMEQSQRRAQEAERQMQ